MIIYAHNLAELKDLENHMFSQEWEEKPYTEIISIICDDKQYNYEYVYEFDKWRIATY